MMTTAPDVGPNPALPLAALSAASFAIGVGEFAPMGLLLTPIAN